MRFDKTLKKIQNNTRLFSDASFSITLENIIPLLYTHSISHFKNHQL